MDHDAMLTDVRKLKQFRDDFMAVSGYGLTPEGLHEMAERARAGKPWEDIREKYEHGVPTTELRRKGEPLGDLPGGGGPAGHDGISPEQFRDLADHVKEVSEAVATLQQAQGQYSAVLVWVTENQGAIQGLIAGSQAAAHAISDAEGSDGASQDGKAPASLPEGEAEPLGTDKSTGEVKRDGEPLETATVDG